MNSVLRVLLFIAVLLVIVLLGLLVFFALERINGAPKGASQALPSKEEDNDADARFVRSLGDFIKTTMTLDEAKTEEEKTEAATAFIDSYIDMVVDGMKMTSEW